MSYFRLGGEYFGMTLSLPEAGSCESWTSSILCWSFCCCCTPICMKYLLVNGNSTLRKTHWSVMLTVHNLHSPPLSLSLSPYYCLLRHSLLCFLTVFLHNFCPVHFFISVTVCLCSCVHVSVCSLVCVCVCGVVWRVVCVCVCFIMYSSHYRPHT